MSSATTPLPGDGQPVPVTSLSLRSALGRFATGVTVITCVDDQGERHGLTANSFNALSLDPALVLWSLRLASGQLAAFRGARHWAVNVLAQSQIDLSRRFAKPGDDRFGAGTWWAGQGGAPVLDGAIAVFECEAWQHMDAGDHCLFIGRVLQLREHAGLPLVYHTGHYRELGGPL